MSLRSGAAVAKALRSLGHEVRELDPGDAGMGFTAGKTDVVFLALHGTYGEDGTVQRRLDELGVLYTGCDAGGEPDCLRQGADQAALHRRPEFPRRSLWW